MTQYRIVSNGIDYRVQWLGKTLFLRRPKWYWLRQYSYEGDWIAEFPSIADAKAAILENEKQDKARKQGYTPLPVEEK